jgi:tRNA nucleotidyltransferase (CCA-adding enzyme)
MATSVSGGFNALLADLDLTDPQKATAEDRVNHLVSYFRDKDVVCANLPFKIGSYERGTVIRWNRDIDVMVALDYATYKARYDDDSAAMLRWIRDRMDAEYNSWL